MSQTADGQYLFGFVANEIPFGRGDSRGSLNQDANLTWNNTTKSLALGTGATIAPDGGTASATAGAATLNHQTGVITSESLTTAAGSTYTLTLTNSKIAAGSVVMAQATLGGATAGTPHVTKITPGSGSVTIVVANIHASAALNGTILVAFQVVKP